MPTSCEACESAPAVVEEEAQEGEPFRVCQACHARLVALALRPIEWYNLAKRHGWWEFLLHDDFYDDDGTAHQPRIEVEHPERHPAPTLDEVRHDPDSLLEYTITQWSLRPEVAAVWQAWDPSSILPVLQRRYAAAKDIDIQSTMLAVAGCSLREHGRQFVTSAWNDFQVPHQLGSLAEASASCLTFEDGFARVVHALATMDEKTRRDHMYALSYFHRPETLDWIESKVDSPVTESWGRLAAASASLGSADSWLKQGRLLSLVALDALAAIVRPQSPLLRDYGPQLENKPDPATFESTLKAYVERDSAPRVQNLVRFLIAHSETLTDQ